MGFSPSKPKSEMEQFLIAFEEAGFSKNRSPEWVWISLRGGDSCTVDELISWLLCDGESDFEKEARKYILGYFGGSGSVTVNCKVGGPQTGWKGVKRDEHGRWI